jgi:hypothetical protein
MGTVKTGRSHRNVVEHSSMPKNALILGLEVAPLPKDRRQMQRNSQTTPLPFLQKCPEALLYHL